MVKSSSVSPKGQVTIPAEIRERFGIRPKDLVTFRVCEDAIQILPLKDRLREGYRSIPPLDPARTWDEVKAVVQEERAERYLAGLDRTAVTERSGE
jgi:AbrB family looped-hinge helix DNA binding protein